MYALVNRYRSWAKQAMVIGIGVSTLAVSVAALAQDGEQALHLNFTRPEFKTLIQGPPEGARAPGFDIVVNFPDMSLTASQQMAFTNAEAFWEGVLTGYRDAIVVANVTIDATAPAIDGPGGVLGSAGPTGGSQQGGFILTTTGSMAFDSADVAALEMSGELEDVIRHEMGHVLGFGTLWDCNPDPNTANGCGFGAGAGTPLYTAGSGEFIGAAATARWQSEFGQMGTPDVELEGGAGTADGHWNEVLGGGGLVGINDGANDMAFELMTGWLNSPTFLSEMTLAQFYDNGFTSSPMTPVDLQTFIVE